MNEARRPNPEEILAALKKEENRRGKLRLFFGMAAGVGKTYAMLKAAQAQLKAGVDVVVGLVETHGREETAALLAGLPSIPRKKVEYRGAFLEEMDLEAILARRPALVLVDELAHTNVPGSRHPKRYQDVADILDAGIDVYSTMNVQHLESRVDMVRLITAVPVRETVPDSVLDLADQIELIDLPPDQLIQRFREGKIYPAERAGRALEHFFQESHLTALREIALRATADKVDSELQDIMGAERIEGWRTDERLMVAVSHSPHSESLIRTARRMAIQLETQWIALYVDTGVGLDEADQNRLVKNLELARELGAEVVTTQDSDLVSAIQRVARARNVMQVVLGRPEPSWLKNFFGGSLLDRLVRDSKDLDIHVLRREEAKAKRRSWWPAARREASPGAYLKILLFAALITAGNWFLEPWIGYRASGFVFLLAVILTGLFASLGPTLLLACISAVLWNFLFIPPHFTFSIKEPEDIMMFLTFFVVALVTGIFAHRLRRQQMALRQREEKTNTLYEVLRSMTLARGVEAVIETALTRISELFDAESCVLGAKEGRLDVVPAYGRMELDEKEQAVAAWSFEHGRIAGWSTDTLPLSSSLSISLKLGDRRFGVLVFRPRKGRELTPDQENLLFVLANQIAVALANEEFEGERRRAQLLRESEQLHQTLLNGISHELRTPLTAILGAASALQEKATSADPEIRREMSEEIVDSVDRLNRVVENLLDMTRLESGMLKPKREWFDLTELVSDALGRLRRPLQKHRIDWQRPAEALYFEGDFHLLEHAIDNLLLNAAAYSPPGSTIALQAQVEGNEIWLRIRDQGPGVPAELKARVFEKFYRLPGSPTGGLGLGLSIAKNLVEIQGGFIEVLNSGQGGAEFRIRLPRQEIPSQVREVEG